MTQPEKSYSLGRVERHVWRWFPRWRLPYWAHGRQGGGVPFMVVECTRCSRLSPHVEAAAHPGKVRCLPCAMEGAGAHQTRVSIERARSYMESIGVGRWVAWR